MWQRGVIGDNKWCSVLFTLFSGFQAVPSGFFRNLPYLFVCLFCNFVLSSIVVVVFFGVCMFQLASLYVVVVGQDCMRLTVLCVWVVRMC